MPLFPAEVEPASPSTQEETATPTEQPQEISEAETTPAAAAETAGQSTEIAAPQEARTTEVEVSDTTPAAAVDDEPKELSVPAESEDDSAGSPEAPVEAAPEPPVGEVAAEPATAEAASGETEKLSSGRGTSVLPLGVPSRPTSGGTWMVSCQERCPDPSISILADSFYPWLAVG